MGVIGWIVLIALTTALAAMYELFIPAVQQLELVSPEDPMVQYKWLTYIVMFFLALLFFVPLLPIVIVPKYAETFRNQVILGMKN